MGRSVFLAALFILSSTASHTTEGLRLNTTFPPRDLVMHYPQVRIAGSCDSSCKVRIQGKEVKVYPTGAFVGLVPLKEGENIIEITAEKRGKTRTERVTVKCVDPLTTSPVSPLTIDGARCEPSVDMVLQEGDSVNVRLKGSPGMRAFWTLGNCVRDASMEEVNHSTNGSPAGVVGIYRASYRIRHGDRVEREKVRFTLVSSKGEKISAVSAGRITLVPNEEITKGEIGGEGAVVSREPGGSRAFELEPGTRVALCGEAGEFYRLKLSPEERYWAPKKAVAEKGRGAWEPASLGRPSVVPGDGGAKVRIPVSAAVPWNITQSDARAPLMLSLYDILTPEGKEKLKGVSPLDSVEISGTGGHARCEVVPMRDRFLWGFSCSRDKNMCALDVRSGPGKRVKGLIVAIDPGHGGAQVGAVSPTGLREKEVNLSVARAVADFLTSKGAKVLLTRESDAELSLAERIEKARGKGADLFVSIHNNSQSEHGDPLERRGADTYYGVTHSQPLAERILASLAKEGVKTNGVHQENFAVILPTDYPAVLVECAYMSHPEDEMLLLKKKYLKRVASAIGKGIMEFVKEAG
ncbi:MAG: N-acetylmuramoyl-L-alanine amidase [Candidatus Aureabacteria bacterium]|nr:N-acetylmuramoyl-L-alanine amidase [Candidatus Auribacterota bacterium]